MPHELVAITEQDGTLSVMLCVVPPAADVTATIAAEIAVTRPTAVSWRRVQAADFPQGRTYRGAWVDRAGRIDVDMPRARGICRARLRALREPLLAELDTAYMRADEDGDVAAKKSIAARKRALRDAPADPRIDRAASTPELDAITASIMDANRIV